jgi:transcriptional regulator with AAA-type ATPase domain
MRTCPVCFSMPRVARNYGCFDFAYGLLLAAETGPCQCLKAHTHTPLPVRRNIKRKTLELLQAYDWPGDIRELQNVIEGAVILSDGDTLYVDKTWLQRESRRPSVAARGLGRLDLDQEKEMIESALRQTRGRVSGPRRRGRETRHPPLDAGVEDQKATNRQAAL